MNKLKMFLIVAVSVCSFALTAEGQEGSKVDSEYITQALSAAPNGVASGAAVVRVEQNGTMRTLRRGSNGFTCMILGTDRMCNDQNSMEFVQALLKHAPPPDKVGVSFMLAGDTGASNTDPFATGKTSTNHWIVTGPHIMIFGPPAKKLGYTRATDPDPTRPYMMWAGTPYEHAMIPLGPPK